MVQTGREKRQEGVGPKGIRPNYTEIKPKIFGPTALKMDRQQNTGLKLDLKKKVRPNFSAIKIYLSLSGSGGG